MATNNEITCYVIAGGVIALLAYWAYCETDRPMAQHVEIAATSGISNTLMGMQEEEHFKAYLATENQQLGYTPHRYPNVTGGNISTLIHYGFSQLRLPSPMDDSWRTRPPAEVMW